MLKINVRRVAPLSDDEDKNVPGVYEVHFFDDYSKTSIQKQASMALDAFHGSVAIGVLDDFDIVVVDEQGKFVEEDDEHESYSAQDCGEIIKIADDPMYVEGEDDGLSAAELDNKYNPDGDGSHPKYSRGDWRDEVANENTISGYWDWVHHSLCSEDDEPSPIQDEQEVSPDHETSLYDVVVSAIGDDGQESEIGKVRVKAGSETEAQSKALDELWDERLTSSSCSASFDVARIPRYIAGNWNHIFSDSQSGKNLRFVFDCISEKVVAMQIQTTHGYQPASSEAMADVEDSLRNANEDALERPEDWGLDAVSALPGWAAESETKDSATLTVRKPASDARPSCDI